MQVIGFASCTCLRMRLTSCDARGFAETLNGPAEYCLVLDALERNSSLEYLNIMRKIGILTHFLLLWSMCWGWVAVVLRTFACNACVCNR